MSKIMMVTTVALTAALGIDPEALAGYERIRSLLARDQTEGLSAEADRLSEAAARVAERSEGALKARFEAAAKAAAKLKEA